MFPGLGSQYVNMGLGLYRSEPVFREEIDRCIEILKPLMDYDIKETLYPHSDCRGGFPCPPYDGVGSPGQGDHRGSPLQSVHINQTEIAQPDWGIKPHDMIG